jgi:ubiquitin-protein ligase
MIDHAHPNLDVYVSERNIGFWKVAMQGPDDSPYEGGVFLLYVDIGADFPRLPPAVRFITPILHPNISKVMQNSHFSLFYKLFPR